MAIKTYARTISDTTVMVKGIRCNQGVLSKFQFDTAFACKPTSTLPSL